MCQPEYPSGCHKFHVSWRSLARMFRLDVWWLEVNPCSPGRNHRATQVSLLRTPKFLCCSMCFPFPGFRRRQSSFFYPSLDALFMFCSALTFPRRLADTRDCFSNRQAKHKMNSLSKHEPFFFCGTISASQEFLLFYYFALQQTTSRGFFCYFFFHDVDFFLLGQPKQHTPQWPLSPNMEPSPGCRTSQLHTSTDLRNTRHLRCNFTSSSPLLFGTYFSQF